MVLMEILNTLVAVLAFIGGGFAIEEFIRKLRGRKLEIARINKLVGEDKLPPVMKDREIRPNEYLLVSLNLLTKMLDNRMELLESAVHAQRNEGG
ncbi:MAG: hypothetical protein ACE5I4_03500 [Thermoplasmata archaeon]